MKPVWVMLVSCFPDKQYRNRHPWKSGSTWLNIRITWRAFKNSVPTQTNGIKINGLKISCTKSLLLLSFPDDSSIPARLRITVLDLSSLKKKNRLSVITCINPAGFHKMKALVIKNSICLEPSVSVVWTCHKECKLVLLYFGPFSGRWFLNQLNGCCALGQ